MGVGPSTMLPAAFISVGRWTRPKLDNVIIIWTQGEFPYSIDAATIEAIVGCTNATAHEMITTLTGNINSTHVNAITLFVVFICLVTDEFVNKADHVAEIFDLFDLQRKNKLTRDELTVMVTTVYIAFSAIVDDQKQLTSVERSDCVKRFCDNIYAHTKAIRHGVHHPISRTELIQCSDETLFTKEKRTINAILTAIKDERSPSSDNLWV
jgi:hypothetical protein